MTVHGWATTAFWAAGVLVVVALASDLLADRHRRSVPDEAWQAAGVDRLIWGRIGVRFLNLPLANVYYLFRIRPRLDAATTDLIAETDSPSTSSSGTAHLQTDPTPSANQS